MFCPRCKSEYREGFFTCADCSVPLVSELPKDEDKAVESDLVPFTEILSTRNPAEIAVIKSILEAEDIAYYFIGEQMMTSPLLSGGSSARLFIAFEDIGRTKELLKDIEFEDPDLLLSIIRKF